MQAERTDRDNTKENMQRAENKEQKKKKEFGLPDGLVTHFVEKGISRKQLAHMEIEEVLEKASALEGRALNKAVYTVLKTTRKPEQMRIRLKMLAGCRKHERAETKERLEDDLVSIINSVLHIHGLSLYTRGEDGFLEFVYMLATEAEHRNVKHAAWFVLTHLSIDSCEVGAVVAEKMDSFFPDTENLEPGQEEKIEQHIMLFAGTRKSKENLRQYVSQRAEALAILVQKSSVPVNVWKRVLEIYAKVEKASLPVSKMRALGLAVLKTLHTEEDLTAAASLYVQSMRLRVHDFGYAQFFVAALQLLPQTKEINHALEKLLIYALTETRVCANSLCNIGMSKLPRDRMLDILEKVRPEKLCLLSGAPVIKQIARALMSFPNDLVRLEKYIAAVLNTRKYTSLSDLLTYIRERLSAADEKPSLIN